MNSYAIAHFDDEGGLFYEIVRVEREWDECPDDIPENQQIKEKTS